jgi:hypothetical protein
LINWESLCGRAGTTQHLVDMGGNYLNTGFAMGRMLLTMAAGFAELSEI